MKEGGVTENWSIGVMGSFLFMSFLHGTYTAGRRWERERTFLLQMLQYSMSPVIRHK